MEQQPNKTKPDFTIVGVNLLIMAICIVISKISGLGGILDAVFLFMQVLVCWGVAIGRQSWMWFLAGLMVLLIGGSTCVKFLFN